MVHATPPPATPAVPTGSDLPTTPALPTSPAPPLPPPELEDVGWALLSPGAYVAYSTLLGVAQETALYPLDVLKTRQQHDLRLVPRSVGSILRELWTHEGVRGLYRGYLANAFGTWPGQVVYYGGYELSKHMFTRALGGSTAPDEDGIESSLSPTRRAAVNLAAGAVADISCLLVHQPADIVSQRLMVATYRREEDRPDKRRDARGRDIVRDIWRTEGARGFFRGYFASVMTYAPASAVWFATYDATKVALRRVRPALRRMAGQSPDKAGLSAWRTGEHLVSGACAGLFSSLLSNPLDVARTRQMCMDITNPHDEAVLRRGYFYVIAWTARREGVRGLFRGLWLRLLVTVPGSAVTFAAYEVVKRLSLKTRQATDE